ncbi:RNA polymerase sigma factor [Egibacter rhizosphaerae]|nr:RNA polymerase sigma factor [Egibacter rhizosphaerae]
MSSTGVEVAAFDDLFERHRDTVHAFLLGRTSDPEAARDLLQEAFLRLWRHLGEVATLEEPRQRAWLITVARNLVIDGYRAEATRTATVANLARDPGVRDGSEPDDTERVALRGQLTRLDAAIARLPEQERVALTMASVAGMTSDEIGEALDRPAGTVRYHLHRARTRLAAELDLDT